MASSRKIAIAALVAVLLVFAIVLGITLSSPNNKNSMNANNNNNNDSSGTSSYQQVENDNGAEMHTVPTADTPAIIQSGDISGVDYYYCGNSNTHTAPTNLVFLHGSAYSHVEWKTSGILDDICRFLPSVALDLTVSADSTRLRQILQLLENDGMIQRPVTLITPSASGWTIVDWLRDGNVALLDEYVSTWVPVAVGSLSSTYVTNDQIRALQNEANVQVLAIYGDGDKAGGRISNKLGDLLDAQVVELVGGHPVYLYSPIEFVDTILDFLGIKRDTKLDFIN